MSDNEERLEPISPGIEEEIDNLFRGNSTKTWKPAPVANVKSIAIKQMSTDGIYTIILAEYDDLQEVMIFHCTQQRLENDFFIDTDFGLNNFLSPVAKFPPTQEGWDLAVGFIKFIRGQNAK